MPFHAYPPAASRRCCWAGAGQKPTLEVLLRAQHVLVVTVWYSRVKYLEVLMRAQQVSCEGTLKCLSPFCRCGTHLRLDKLKKRKMGFSFWAEILVAPLIATTNVDKCNRRQTRKANGLGYIECPSFCRQIGQSPSTSYTNE